LNQPEGTLKIFDRIKNENFIFKVLITDSNIRYQSDNFKVLKVYTTDNENNSDKGRKRTAAALAPSTPHKKTPTTKKNVPVENEEEEEDMDEEKDEDMAEEKDEDMAEE
ncbi:hypothetical protein MKX03_000159, partial [Papaver bracteatum]